MRLELTRPNGHYPLKVARLPIPPPGHLLGSEKRDSNPRPRPWQGRALPTELFSRFGVQDETRTHTAKRPLPPQRSASTNSAIWTRGRDLYIPILCAKLIHAF